MKIALSIITAFLTILSPIANASVDGQPVQPKSACEELAVKLSRPIAESAAGSYSMAITAIDFIGANHEFNIEFSNSEETIVVSVNITSGSRESSCTLNRPYVLSND